MPQAVSRRQILDAISRLPGRDRDWLESDDIELFSYYGWGVVPTSAQLEMWQDIQTWPPGTIHNFVFANRTGKTTGLTLFELWAMWKKWRFTAGSDDAWLGYSYRVLWAAPLSGLASKAWELADAMINNSAIQQLNPLTGLTRPARLASFFHAGKTVDVTGVDRAVVTCLNNSQLDYYSTQGGAGRMESEAWWVLVWDEYVRQQPVDDIPLLIDQTFLPRSSDFEAPIILSGTLTEDAEPIYLEMEDLARANESDWNIRHAARDTNFSQTQSSIDRQIRLSTDAQAAERSVGGKVGAGAGELFPHFVLRNAFLHDLPDRTFAPVTEADWRDFDRYYTFVMMFDHGIGHDPNVVQTWRVPWPPSRIGLENPIIGVDNRVLKAGRALTPDEQQGYLGDAAAVYRPKFVIIDATAAGGLMAYRAARARGLPVVDCTFNARAAKGTSNKEYGLQALQQLLGWGLGLGKDGLVEAWPEPDPEHPFGVLKLPESWTRLHRQLAVLRRYDEKQTQDQAMTSLMGAWFLYRMIENPAVGKPQRFNVMARRR
jgi:hypothetical protein